MISDPYQFIATVALGSFTGAVAFNQWMVSHNKLRLDLFDKRYKVYDSTRRFLVGIQQSAKLPDDSLWTFYRETGDAVFLFKAEIRVFLKEISTRAIDMNTCRKLYDPLPVSERRSCLVQREYEHIIWLGEQLDRLPQVFAPYLDFSDVRIGAVWDKMLRQNSSNKCDIV